MIDSILATLKIIGWLGIILALLTIVNTVCGIIVNTNGNNKFDKKILFKGLLKALVFYICSALLAICFTLLPFVNSMITKVYDIQLITNDSLTTLSTIGVFGIVVSVIIVQGKKALEKITELTHVKAVQGELLDDSKEE